MSARGTPRQRQENGEPPAPSLPKSKAKAKPKAVLGRVAPKAASPKKTDASTPTTPRDRGPPRKPRTDMGTNRPQPRTTAGKLRDFELSGHPAGHSARQSPDKTSIAPASSDVTTGFGGVTSRDGGLLIHKDDPALEAARVPGEIEKTVDLLEVPHQRERNSSSCSSAVQVVAASPYDSPFPEGADWRAPPDEDVAENPLGKESDFLASLALGDVVGNSHANDECEREWSQLNGLSGKIDKVIDLFATNFQAASQASGSIDRSTTSAAMLPPQKRETHHQILQLQEEVKKLQAPYDELQARGQRDLDTQVAIARLQMELQTLKEAVTVSNAVPPDSSHGYSPEASILAAGANSVVEPRSIIPPSLVVDATKYPTNLRTSYDVMGANKLPPNANDIEFPAPHQSLIAEPELLNNAEANLGLRRDGRDQELQQLLDDVYNKICVCLERLKEQKVASKAAISGLESFQLPDNLLNDADDARRDTWEEIDWLRRALVGMHQHLVYAQERTRTLEQQCQEYEAHVETLVPNGDQALLSASFESDRSQVLQATSDYARPTDSVMVARDSSPERDLTLQPTYGDVNGPAFPPTAPLLTSPPKVRPPKNYVSKIGSSAAAMTLSPPKAYSSFENGSTNAIGMAMRAMPPMQDLDTSSSLAYEPYMNVSSSAAWSPPMVAATPPISGLAISGSSCRMQSLPRSVLTPTAVSIGSTAEAYPSGVASVGAPSRPITMKASYASGSSSVGVPGRHIPASSSRAPSMSPLRQQRPMISPGSPPVHLQQGLTQCIAVAPGSSSNGTALFNRIDSNKDGVIDRWELKAAMKVGTVKPGSGVQRHVADQTSVVGTPRTPAPMFAWQTAYPSTMQYFAPMTVGPARSVSRERKGI